LTNNETLQPDISYYMDVMLPVATVVRYF